MILFFYVIVFGPFAAEADNLALLSGTLRTFQRSGCDDDVVSLKCPPGTSISIQLAQYGKSAPSNSLCGQKNSQNSNVRTSNASCLWPSAIQSKWEEVAQGNWGRYSLLQTVVEACQKKRQCKFQTSAKTFGGDPCPGIRKYVEVAYKCRPYEFRSKVACENERIQLKCNPLSRVAVFSASYGRTEYESFQCPQPQGVSEETCLVSYATETVMHICHGKRSCELSADASTFGNPCRPESRMYLKVVYTCVPRKVLRDQYEGRLEPDEVETDINDHDEEDDFDNYDDGNEFIRESAASPPAPSVEGTSKGDNLTKDSPATSSKLPPHSKSKEYDSENQERFYLYLILSIGGGVLLCLTLLVVRLLIQRHRARRDAKFHATTVTDNSLPNGFTDDISEVDADIDLSTPLPNQPVTIHSPVQVGNIAEVVRYPHVHSQSLRRMPDSDAPRSLNSSSNSHYYYG